MEYTWNIIDVMGACNRFLDMLILALLLILLIFSIGLVKEGISIMKKRAGE
ncbi:MAG: hypothetical protein Q4G11_02600 [Gallicola sp.]|nr:hypothetical protein [Gallicola sp.]